MHGHRNKHGNEDAHARQNTYEYKSQKMHLLLALTSPITFD